MREDHHHDIQTPKKEHNLPVSSNRKAKSVNDPSKKLHNQQQKIVKRNLNSVFTTITDDDDAVSNSSEKESIEKKISSISKSDDSIVEINETRSNSNPEESIGITPVSEAFVFDKDQSSKSIESYIVSLNQFVSPSTVAVGSVETTPFLPSSFSETSPMSSMTTVQMTPSSSPITVEADAAFVTKEETDSFNRGLLVMHLRKSMSQVLHSADIDSQYKRLLDVLVKMVIQEFFSSHEEKDIVVEVFSKKVKTLLVSLVVCIFVSSGFILFSGVKSSYNGPPPT
ncbi:hypothetical protein OSB04_007143 [Centaurea solstitialis]|uniref:Uncharacterized protein n=1 Tax=Centaurea solstitialis TaxID=347529 RepID=A0AA38U3W2_9ASTR|nr:hypothetical protein OSB04_007143 [Centaurea solstitialis]